MGLQGVQGLGFRVVISGVISPVIWGCKYSYPTCNPHVQLPMEPPKWCLFGGFGPVLKACGCLPFRETVLSEGVQGLGFRAVRVSGLGFRAFRVLGLGFVHLRLLKLGLCI